MPDGSFKVAHLWKGYGYLFDVLSGSAHDPDLWTSIFMTDEFKDPQSWAIYGARKAGWKPTDFPLRYSVPSDVEAICGALAALTETEVRERVEHVSGQSSPNDDRKPRLEQTLRALSDLRGFYQQARGSGEIVLYLMG